MSQRRQKKAQQVPDEEEEYEQEVSSEDGNNYSRSGNDLSDEKDRIIHKQKQMIEEMQNEFAATLDSLQAEFRAFMEDSAQVQAEMLERIKELKAELNQAKKKSARSGTSSAAVKSSLYSNGPKHPRKLAQGDARRSAAGFK